MKNEECCNVCRYYVRNRSLSGTCHFGCPQICDYNATAVWPKVNKTDWCGNFDLNDRIVKPMEWVPIADGTPTPNQTILFRSVEEDYEWYEVGSYSGSEFIAIDDSFVSGVTHWSYVTDPCEAQSKQREASS